MLGTLTDVPAFWLLFYRGLCMSRVKVRVIRLGSKLWVILCGPRNRKRLFVRRSRVKGNP